MPRHEPRGRFRVDRSGDHAIEKRRRRWPIFVLLGSMVVVVVAGVFGLLLLQQALSVRDDLNAAKEGLASINGLVKTGDTEQIDKTAQEVLERTTHAEETVRGGMWSVAASIPLVGQNVAAVRSATEATHILVRDALPPGIRLLTNLQPSKIKLSGGGFNLEPFKQAQDDLPTLAAAFSQAQEKVAGIDRSELLPFVDSAIGELLDVVTQSGPALAAVEDVLPTMLDIMGAKEPRRYLLIFQNNAEIRATGGNPAAVTVVEADDGKIEMLAQADSRTFYDAGATGYAHSTLPDSTMSIYESDTLEFSQNFTRTPNFPTTAKLFKDLWADTVGSTVDGVISVDPVVLSMLLKVTGPVTTSDGTEVNSENCVKLLLSDTYARFGPGAYGTDEFFADVAARVFDKLASGDWDISEMAEQLTKAADEQRIYVWFDRESEEAMAVKYELDGAMATSNEKTTEVGIFLNDASYSKLEYYLKTEVAVTCNVGDRTITTSITMSNSAPGGLNSYVNGARNNKLGFAANNMLLDVLYFAPPGAEVDSSDPGSGELGWDRSGVEDERNVRSMTFAVGSGDSRTVSYTSTLPSGKLGPVSVRYSPTVTNTPVTIDKTCGELTSAGT